MQRLRMLSKFSPKLHLDAKEERSLRAVVKDAVNQTFLLHCIWTLKEKVRLRGGQGCYSDFNPASRLDA